MSQKESWVGTETVLGGFISRRKSMVQGSETGSILSVPSFPDYDLLCSSGSSGESFPTGQSWRNLFLLLLSVNMSHSMDPVSSMVQSHHSI